MPELNDMIALFILLGKNTLRVVSERNHHTKQFVVTRLSLLVDTDTIQLAQQTVKYSQASRRMRILESKQRMLALLRPNSVMSLLAPLYRPHTLSSTRHLVITHDSCGISH